MKPLICFDMDNTLLRSDKIHIYAFNQAFKEEGLKKISTKKFKRELNGQNSEKLIKKFFPTINKEKLNQIIKKHDKIVIKKAYTRAVPIRGALKALKETKKNFTIAIISNCNTSEIRPILKGAKIEDHLFNKIIGHDKVKHSKPAPDLIFKAEKLTHHKAVCIIGDSIFDIRAGKKAKIKTIGVTTGHNTSQELRHAGATVIINNISKVTKALQEIFLK